MRDKKQKPEIIIDSKIVPKGVIDEFIEIMKKDFVVPHTDDYSPLYKDGEYTVIFFNCHGILKQHVVSAHHRTPGEFYMSAVTCGQKMDNINNSKLNKIFSNDSIDGEPLFMKDYDVTIAMNKDTNEVTVAKLKAYPNEVTKDKNLISLNNIKQRGTNNV